MGIAKVIQGTGLLSGGRGGIGSGTAQGSAGFLLAVGGQAQGLCGGGNEFGDVLANKVGPINEVGLLLGKFI